MDDVTQWSMNHRVHSSVTNCMEMENMCFSFDCLVPFSCRCALGTMMKNYVLNPFIHLLNVVFSFLQ